MPGTSPVIIPVRQRTPEWLAAKQHGIGSSQAAAALGISPWQSRISLWAEFLGLVPPEPPTIPMLVGTELEPLIGRLYTEATGVKVRRAMMLRQHPEHAFMLASLDRRAGRKPIELKWSARGDGYGDPGTDEVPDDVLAQVLHQLAVVDEPEADVAALIGRREAIQVYTIRRDAEAEAAIIEREAELWHHVETRTEPPLDGSDATRAYLAARYPRDSGIAVEADPGTAGEMQRLRTARGMREHWDGQQAEAEAAIKAFMGEATKLVAPGLGAVTWKTTKDTERTDWKALSQVYGKTVDTLVEALRGRTAELVLEGVDVSTDEGLATMHEALTSLYTITTPGSRRFGPPRWEEED